MKKAKTNYTKHKVSFEEAQTVFYDENALLIADEKHSDNEERFILMGLSMMMKLSASFHLEKQTKKKMSNIGKGGQNEKQL